MRINLTKKASLVIASSMALCYAQAQTRIGLTQLPNCSTTGIAANTPILLVALPSLPGGSIQYSCYVLSGATVTPATATSPATLTITVDAPTVETPGGTVDGTNAAFTIANTPIGSVQLYRNGLLLAAGTDYTITGSAITFQAAAVPQMGDILQAIYRH